MDFVFAATGKPTHAQPPGWYYVLAITAGITYWSYLKIRYWLRKRCEQPETKQGPLQVAPATDPQPAAIESNDDAGRRRAVALADLERWLAYTIVMAGFIYWTVIEPPPGRWLPVIALLLAGTAA